MTSIRKNKLFTREFCNKVQQPQKFRERWNFKQYGKYGIIIYLSTFITVFPTFYFLIKNNYINKNWLIEKLEGRGINTKTYIDKFGEGKINFALAYLCLFVTKPLRIIFTCVLAGALSRNKAPDVNEIKKSESSTLNSNTKNNNINNTNKSNFCSKNTNPKIETGYFTKYKQYGKPGIILYWCFYATTGIMFYYGLEYELFKKTFIENLFSKSNWINEKYMNIKKSDNGEKRVNFYIAFLLNELFDVIRIPLLLLILKTLAKKKII